MTSRKQSLLKHVPNSALFVSEPNPSWFGNAANESKPNWTNQNWLKSRFHFAFAEYRNERNSQFGCLRVMNDDLVQPKRGRKKQKTNLFLESILKISINSILMYKN